MSQFMKVYLFFLKKATAKNIYQIIAKMKRLHSFRSSPCVLTVKLILKNKIYFQGKSSFRRRFAGPSWIDGIYRGSTFDDPRRFQIAGTGRS
jgi:hypothetical protein